MPSSAELPATPQTVISEIFGIRSFQVLPSELNSIAVDLVGSRVATIGPNNDGGPPAAPVKIASSAARCAASARASTYTASVPLPCAIGPGVVIACAALSPEI